MVRRSWVLLLGVLLGLASGSMAAEKKPAGKKPVEEKTAGKGPAGIWRVAFLLPQQQVTFGVIKLQSKDNKWTGTILAKAEQFGMAPITIANVAVEGGIVRFELKLRGPAWTFDGKLSKDKQMILGSIELPGRSGSQIYPARLESTTITSLDAVSQAKHTLAKNSDSHEAFEALFILLKDPAENKLKPQEIKRLADKVFEHAGAYGARYQRSIALRLAEALDNDKGMAGLALEYGQKLEKLMDAKTPVADQIRTLELVVMLLEKAKKPKEVKPYLARILELRSRTHDDDLQKALTFKPDPYKGRAGKSTRVVLVEAFTGAQCEVCPAVDIALNGLGKTYKPADVVVLQYHLNFAGPDPLSNPDDKERYKYYFDQIEGTPSVLFNGKSGAPGGGPVADAEDKYHEYRDIIDPLLEKTSKVKVGASAERTGHKIAIKAEASGLDKPGDNLRLRLALVEGWVAYAGKNGQRFHLHVVRDMPGGAGGLALVQQTNKQTVTVDLDKVRTKLDNYLDNYAKHRAFPNKQRPLDFKNLSVVAFVQNDKTREVLQAIQVKVSGEGPKGKEITEDVKKGEKEKKKKTREE